MTTDLGPVRATCKKKKYFSDPHCKVPTTYKILQPNEYWTICGNVYFKQWYCVDRATYMSKGH